MTIYLGETIEIQNTITDKNGNPVNPTSHNIVFYDENGNAQGTFTNPTQVSTGVFTIDFTIPANGAQGTWKCVWTVVYGGNTGIEEFKFLVYPPEP